MTFQPYLQAATLLSSILLNVICDETTTSKPPTGCPEGYRPFRTKCYKIYSNFLEGKEPKMFEDANEFCQKERGNLASINSKEEQDFLTAYLGEPSVTNLVWIGLKKDSGWGQKWIDGSDDKYFRNFAPGEPNGGSGEGCFHLQSGENVAGMWNDVSCASRKGFICQTDRIGGSQEKLFQKDGLCPEGLRYYRDTCYRLVQNEADFWTAEAKCEKDYDGHLTSIRDNYEEAFLAILTVDEPQNVWIGFSDHLNDLMKGKFGWTDGSHVYHTNWKGGQPANSSEDRCVANTPKGSGWTVEACAKKLPFLCSKRQTPVDLGETHIGTCPNGWIDVHNQYCYFIETSYDRSYYSAKTECSRKTRNGTLAMFESAHDLFLLRPALSKHLTKEFTIGIKQSLSRDTVFEFVNQKQATYLPWADGEPNNLRHEGCVEVNARTLEYNNYGCANNRNYICQTDKVIHQTIKNGRFTNATGVAIVTQGVQTPETRKTTTLSMTTGTNSERTPKTVRIFTDTTGTSSRISTYSQINNNKDMAHRVSEDNGKEDKGLSQEAVTLIGVGVVLVALGLIFTTYFVYRRRRLYEKAGDDGIIRFQNEAD